jgi:Cys-tRNA(Pro)/Cys-tRNA(Cys) deacylase
MKGCWHGALSRMLGTWSAVSEDRYALVDSLLLRLGARARAIRHADLGSAIHTGHDFARAMGCAPNQVAKTLLLRDNAPTGPGASSKKRYAVFALAQSDRLDLNAVRATLKTGEAQLASRNEIQQVLGTVPSAVSPFMTGSIPVYVDEKLLCLHIIFVNGGVPGVDIEIAPADLVEVTRAQVGRYSLDSTPR